MERSDENSSLRNWILARNFLKKLFWPLFLRVDCSQLQDASIKPLCRVCSQKLKFLWPTVAFFELSEYTEIYLSYDITRETVNSEKAWRGLDPEMHDPMSAVGKRWTCSCVYSTVRSLLCISGKSFLLTHCPQICIRKEISRPGFLDVNR